MELQDLLYRSIIIDSSVPGLEVLDLSPFIDQAAEPQICFKSIVERFCVLWFQNLTNELHSCIVAEFRALESSIKRWAATGRERVSSIS